MPISVDVPELQSILATTPANQNIMLVGAHGIGKSQLISAFYAEQGMKVVPFFLGQMSDPGDLIGLMHRDESVGKSLFLPPYWWPTDDAPVVLFLDELNRARPEILQSIMELTLNKTLAGRQLPAGSVVVAAVNIGEAYQLTDLDPALVSRFNVYHFQPTIDDWLKWAITHSVDPRLIEFLTEQPQLLDGEASTTDESSFATSDLEKSPDRRAWARVSDVIAPKPSLAEIDFKLVAGIVGDKATAAFRRFCNARLPFRAGDILEHWERHQPTIKELSVAESIECNDSLLRHVNLYGDATDPSQCSQWNESLLQYLKLRQRQKLDEVVAHFVSSLNQPNFSAARKVTDQSVELCLLIAAYLETVETE